MGKKKKNITNYRNNFQFIDSNVLNDSTYLDYLNRFKKICLSIFEWINLPETMNAQFLEKCLYEDGQCALLNDENYGFINTRCVSNGYLNIYDLPSSLNCFSHNYSKIKKLYTGLKDLNNFENSDLIEDNINNSCILVQNNWDRTPTMGSMELFAYRLYELERTCDVNIKSQKFPVLVLCSEQQRLMMKNLYSQYDGNQPFIFGDKNQLNSDTLKAINTDAPFVADKLQECKKEIWNEALTFLGINNIMTEKKERLISDEANSNNELINLNLQSSLAPRQLACEQFNKKFNLIGTEREISVRVRSDLHNIIKNAQSIIQDYKDTQDLEVISFKEGDKIG